MSERDSVAVILYHDDFPFEDRRSVEDKLDVVLLPMGVQWIGSGTRLGDRSCSDIQYLASDGKVAASAIRQELEEMGAGRSTEIRVGDEFFPLYE